MTANERLGVARQARAGAVLSAALLMMAPNAVAAPAIPDVDSLIDDSGTLPGSISDLPSAPIVVFATDSGLVCRVWQGKITHDVNCTGDIPGAPPDARSVQLPGIYGKGTIPARFVAGPPEALVGGSPPTARLPVGHKIVFWDFPPTQSMVCGVPPSTELVCVLKEPQRPGDAVTGPVVTHGFVIAAPQSQVF